PRHSRRTGGQWPLPLPLPLWTERSSIASSAGGPFSKIGCPGAMMSLTSAPMPSAAIVLVGGPPSAGAAAALPRLRALPALPAPVLDPPPLAPPAPSWPLPDGPTA
ncbi:hypothetical protein Vafri_17658, partial [Volvox africanus]